MAHLAPAQPLGLCLPQHREIKEGQDAECFLHEALSASLDQPREPACGQHDPGLVLPQGTVADVHQLQGDPGLRLPALERQPRGCPSASPLGNPLLEHQQ